MRFPDRPLIVATPYEANLEGDQFRIEDGQIVAHWDAAEPTGPEDEWVNSGKF